MHFLIIGVGSIGERHLRNFLRLDDVRCSIAELNPTTRSKIADQYDVQDSFADYRDSDLPGYDGVVICVPANIHVPIACDVLAASTHVLTEKPLAMSLEGVDNLKRLRDQKNLVVSVAFPFRTHALTREIKERLDAKELGPVRLVNFYSGQYWPRMRKDYPPQYAQKRETGGGAIPDMLVHFVNLIEWLFGPPDEVSAKHWRLALDDVATEDTAFVTLRFPGGEIAQLGVCLCQRDTVLSLQVVGDAGTLRMTHNADTLDVFTDRTSAWTPGAARTPDRDDLFRDQAQHFIDCIQRRAQPVCSVEDAEQTLHTVLAALQSADTDGRFIKVNRA